VSRRKTTEDYTKIARAKLKKKEESPDIPSEYLDKLVEKAWEEGRISSEGDIYSEE